MVLDLISALMLLKEQSERGEDSLVEVFRRIEVQLRFDVGGSSPVREEEQAYQSDDQLPRRDNRM